MECSWPLDITVKTRAVIQTIKMPAFCVKRGQAKEARQMVRVGKHNMAIKLALITGLIVVDLLCMMTCAYAQDDQLIDASTVIKERTITQAVPEKKTNPVNYSIIGLSLGGMFLASAIHWLDSRRHTLEAELSALGNFVAQTNSVDFTLNMSNDEEPMMDGIHSLQSAMDGDLAALKGNKGDIVRILAEVEINLLRRFA